MTIRRWPGGLRSWALAAASFIIVLGILSSVDVRAECPPWVRRYLAEWSRTHPEGLSTVPRSTTPAEQRLAQFREGMSGEAEHVGQGVEGRVYINPLNPDRTIKVWRAGAVEHMDEGVDYLIAIRKDIQQVPELSQRLRVVQVYERGPTWIVRDYVKVSRPLREAVGTDPAARQITNELMRFLNANRGTNKAIEKIRKMLTDNPISVNLHWDPDAQQVVLIDGF